MENKPDTNVGKYVHRHLSQLKVITRLMEHELDASKGGRDVTLERQLIESVLDSLEIFIEDCEGATGGRGERTKSGEGKPAVTRLN